MQELKEGGTGFKFFSGLWQRSLAEGGMEEFDVQEQFLGGVFSAQLLGCSLEEAGQDDIFSAFQ